MTSPAITEVSTDDLIVRYSDRKFVPVARDIAVPAVHSGRYVAAVAVITDVELNDAQEAALKTAIEAIAGVQFAHIMVGASRLSLDQMPADTAEKTFSFHAQVRMGFDIRETPVP